MFFCTEDTVELEFDSTVITMKPTFNVAWRTFHSDISRMG